MIRFGEYIRNYALINIYLLYKKEKLYTYFINVKMIISIKVCKMTRKVITF